MPASKGEDKSVHGKGMPRDHDKQKEQADRVANKLKLSREQRDEIFHNHKDEENLGYQKLFKYAQEEKDFIKNPKWERQRRKRT